MAIGALTFAACTQEPSQNQKPTKEYVVSLMLGGEITDVFYSDLTKGENDHDLYGIQVDATPAGENNYVHYAYGLFDSLEGVTITLLDGYEYKFVATLLKDGKEKIRHYEWGYSDPFDKEIVEEFVYSVNSYLGYLHQGSTRMSDDGYYNCPTIDRYYGELEGFIPGDSENVTIQMKRVVFGLRVNASGLTEGTLTVNVEGAPTQTIAFPDTEFDEVFGMRVIKSNYGESAYTTENYKETITVSITWTKDNDKVVPIASRQIDFYRNKKTTINVTVEDLSLTPGIAVSLEDDPMGDGGSYDI